MIRKIHTLFKCIYYRALQYDKKNSSSFNCESSSRTSDGGNGNHSVSLPIILIKIKVDQMLPSSYISSLLVSIL